MQVDKRAAVIDLVKRIADAETRERKAHAELTVLNAELDAILEGSKRGRPAAPTRADSTSGYARVRAYALEQASTVTVSGAAEATQTESKVASIALASLAKKGLFKKTGRGVFQRIE